MISRSRQALRKTTSRTRRATSCAPCQATFHCFILGRHSLVPRSSKVLQIARARLQFMYPCAPTHVTTRVSLSECSSTYEEQESIPRATKPSYADSPTVHFRQASVCNRGSPSAGTEGCASLPTSRPRRIMCTLQVLFQHRQRAIQESEPFSDPQEYLLPDHHEHIETHLFDTRCVFCGARARRGPGAQQPSYPSHAE